MATPVGGKNFHVNQVLFQLVIQAFFICIYLEPSEIGNNACVFGMHFSQVPPGYRSITKKVGKFCILSP